VDPVSTSITKAAGGGIALLAARKGIGAFLRPIAGLWLAALPLNRRQQYLEGKLTVLEVSAREEIFTKITHSLGSELAKRTEKLVKARTPLSILKAQEEIDILERSLSYLSTIRMTLGRLGAERLGAIGLGESSPQESSKEETSPSWFDMFRNLAEQRSEPWRRELLAEAARIELEVPGSISLRSLWNISLLDDHVFEFFTGFLESCAYMDGYPCILIEEAEQIQSAAIFDRKGAQASLLVAATTLIEYGLVSLADFGMESAQAIKGLTKTRHFTITHQLPETRNPIRPELRFSGYHCSDLGLDLARLCGTPKLNEHSELSLNNLIELMKDHTEVRLDYGKITT
jgi:Protein of unknown function (DUF2806)